MYQRRDRFVARRALRRASRSGSRWRHRIAPVDVDADAPGPRRQDTRGDDVLRAPLSDLRHDSHDGPCSVTTGAQAAPAKGGYPTLASGSRSCPSASRFFAKTQALLQRMRPCRARSALGRDVLRDHRAVPRRQDIVRRHRGHRQSSSASEGPRRCRSATAEPAGGVAPAGAQHLPVQSAAQARAGAAEQPNGARAVVMPNGGGTACRFLFLRICKWARMAWKLARSIHLWLAHHARRALRAARLAIREGSVRQPFLCTDATGVLVRNKERCRTGPLLGHRRTRRHVLFSTCETTRAVLSTTCSPAITGISWPMHRRLRPPICERRRRRSELLGALPKVLLQDARLRSPTARRPRSQPYRRALPDRANDRRCPHGRSKGRFAISDHDRSRGLFSWVRWRGRERPRRYAYDLEWHPLARAKSAQGLTRFLNDGRPPIHNNMSELALRRQAVGRKNWLFVWKRRRSGERGLRLAARDARMHDVEPWTYLP